MKRIKALTLLAISLLSGLSFAGGMEGGGGVGVRCGTKLELLEVHEAKIRGVQLLRSPSTEAEAIDLVTKLAADSSWYPVFESKDEYADFIRQIIIKPIFKGQDFVMGTDENGETLYGKVVYVPSLSLSNDYGNYQIERNCHLEQIAYMVDDAKSPTLKIVKSLWNELDWLSKSVLVAHETLYAADRNEGTIRDLAQVSLGKNSEWTRKYLIKMFSVAGVTGSMDGLPEKGEYLSCLAYMEGDEGDQLWTEFYAYKSGAGLTLLINGLLDKSEFYQVRTDLKNITLEDLENFEPNSQKSSGSLVYVDAGVASGLEIELEKNSGQEPILRVFDISTGNRIPVGKPHLISCTL